MNRLGIAAAVLLPMASCACGGGTCGADFQCFYPLDGGCLITPPRCCSAGDAPICHPREHIAPIKVDLNFDGGSCMQGAALGGCG